MLQVSKQQRIFAHSHFLTQPGSLQLGLAAWTAYAGVTQPLTKACDCEGHLGASFIVIHCVCSCISVDLRVHSKCVCVSVKCTEASARVNPVWLCTLEHASRCMDTTNPVNSSSVDFFQQLF